MRYLTLLLLLAVPVAAGAQQGERERRPAPRPHEQRRAETPRIGQPLLPAGWQWFGSDGRGPRIGQPLLPAGQQWFGTPGQERRGRPHRPGGWYNPYGGYGAGYFAAPYETQESSGADQRVAMQTTGLLRLEITPATGLQYYVDGLFIGSSSELGLEFELNAGPRRIEIRAPGYKPLVFDTRIDEGRVSTYRGALEPLDAVAPEAWPKPSGSSTMYIIPGCFMGNAPPRQEHLPKGCDISQVRTR